MCVVHVVMGWSWVSLSTLPPHLCGPAAVLLQMKLPASLLGPYSHMPILGGGGRPSVPPPALAPAPPEVIATSVTGRFDGSKVKIRPWIWSLSAPEAEKSVQLITNAPLSSAVTVGWIWSPASIELTSCGPPSGCIAASKARKNRLKTYLDRWPS